MYRLWGFKKKYITSNPKKRCFIRKDRVLACHTFRQKKTTVARTTRRISEE